MAPPASYSLLTELVSSRPTMCPNQVKRHLLKNGKKKINYLKNYLPIFLFSFDVFRDENNSFCR